MWSCLTGQPPHQRPCTPTFVSKVAQVVFFCVCRLRWGGYRLGVSFSFAFSFLFFSFLFFSFFCVCVCVFVCLFVCLFALCVTFIFMPQTHGPQTLARYVLSRARNTGVRV